MGHEDLGCCSAPGSQDAHIMENYQFQCQPCPGESPGLEHSGQEGSATQGSMMGQARHVTPCHPLHTTTSLVAPTDKSNRLGTVACEERPAQGTPSSQHLGLPKTPAGGGVSSPCPAENKERGLLPALSLACYQPQWFNKAGRARHVAPGSPRRPVPHRDGASTRRVCSVSASWESVSLDRCFFKWRNRTQEAPRGVSPRV